MESIQGSFNYTHTICLTEDLLREIDALYRNYFDEEAKYKVNLGAHTIYFNELNEIFALDNFAEEKIKEITIGSILESYIKFEVHDSYLRDASSTVEVEYRIDSSDNANNYRRKLEKIFDKGKRSRIYDFFAHFSIGTMWLLITVISFWNSTYTYFYSNSKASSSITPLIFALAIICVLILALLLDYLFKCIKKLFPPLVFCWGEEQKVESNRKTIRAGLFWSVIIAAIVSIVCGIIVNSIT